MQAGGPSVSAWCAQTNQHATTHLNVRTALKLVSAGNTRTASSVCTHACSSWLHAPSSTCGCCCCVDRQLW